MVIRNRKIGPSRWVSIIFAFAGIGIMVSFSPIGCTLIIFITSFLFLAVLYPANAFIFIVILLPILRAWITVHTGFFDITLSYLTISILFFAVVTKRLQLGKGLALPKTPLNVPFVLFLLVLLLLSLFSMNPLTSLKETVQFGFYILICLITISIGKDPEIIRKVVKYWVASLFIFTLLGYLFLVIESPPGIEVNLTSVSPSVSLFYISSGLHYSRLSFGFGNGYDQTANFLLIGAFLSLGLTSKHEQKNKKPIYKLAFITIVIAILFTYTRGAWIALAGGLVTFFLIEKRRDLVIIIFLVLLLLIITSQTLLSRFLEIFGGFETSKATRIVLMLQSLKICKQYPLFGTGLGTIGSIPIIKLEQLGEAEAFFPPEKGFVYTVHSFLFRMLAETGIAGIAAFLLIILVSIKTLLNARKASVTPQERIQLTSFLACVSALTIHSIFLDMVFDWFWIILGLSMAYSITVLSKEREHKESKIGW